MQINVSRKLSDSSLISPISNDREELDKYNNRPPIKKNPEDIEEINSEEKAMDFANPKKNSLPKDYKTSIFFTGFHHKAFVDTVQMAQTKNNCRSRSTSPLLPPIPYTKKPQSPLPKNSRPKLVRDLPQTHNPETSVKQLFPSRVLVSRSTSPIDIKSETKEENPPTKKDSELEISTPKEDPEQIFHLDELQDSAKPSQNSIRDETVTPSKILRHFQFKHSETKGIPKDIPEKLLNRSQRSNFDEAFREIVQNGCKFDPTSENEEFVKVGQRSRYSKSFQGEKKSEKDEQNEKELFEKGCPKPEETISKHKCCQYKYHKRSQKEEPPGRIFDGNGSNRDESSERIQLLDQGRGTRSEDAFFKKVYQKGFLLREKSVSEEVLQNDPGTCDQGKVQKLFSSEDRRKNKGFSLGNKSSQAENCVLHQFRKINGTHQSPNEISEVLYYNYGRCTFKDLIKSKFSENNIQEASPNMGEKKFPLKKSCYGPDSSIQHQTEEPHKSNRNLCMEDLGTWKYYQHTSAHMLNNSNNFLEAHHRVSSTSISFNGSKRPSSVPPLKRNPRKYQNPREIRLGNVEQPPKSNQRKRTLIESIKSKVFPGVPCRVSEDLSSWDEPKSHGDNLKFPKETKNAVMMMLSGAKSRVLWKTDEKHQASLVRHISEKSPCLKENRSRHDRSHLPCSKNLLCEKGLHAGKCRKSDRGLMMRYSKPCLCKERRFWCSECQNVWPGSAKRCEDISFEEMDSKDAFLEIMEPAKIENGISRKKFYQKDLICNFQEKTDQ